VNKICKVDFDLFNSSGCYDHLIKRNLLVPHKVIAENLTGTSEWYQTLQPEKIDFISYPYEWSSEMLRDAALLTLRLAKEAIPFGLMLKDATPYNIQWHHEKLIFIDTLSFEKYNETEPWIAYRQFCECFLGPLLLMHYSKMPLQQLQLAYPEGIPLHITRSLLPTKSRFSLYTYLHIHLHAGIASKKNTTTNGKTSFSKQKLLNLLNSLEALIRKLQFPHQQSAWSEYYDEAAKRNDYLEQKKKIIDQWINQLTGIKRAIDLGANEGEFSQLLAGKNITTIAADFDPWCINNLYAKIKSGKLQNIQPLIIDLSDPSPAIGVNNTEKVSFLHRCDTDLALALALIHHLVIGKNIPFEKTSELFRQTGSNLIVEFVPKQDAKVQQMLKTKKDIYLHYDEEHFLNAFEKDFSVIDRKTISGTERVLFLMKRKS
ncbi:MAG: SAM-dependent methyltransferase, partial [Bacteroidota bacterium]